MAIICEYVHTAPWHEVEKSPLCTCRRLDSVGADAACATLLISPRARWRENKLQLALIMFRGLEHMA